MYRVKHGTGAGSFSIVAPTAADAQVKLEEMREDYPDAAVYTRDGKLIEEAELRKLVKEG